MAGSLIGVFSFSGNFSLFGHGATSAAVNLALALLIIYLLALLFLFAWTQARSYTQDLIVLELIPPGFMSVKPQAFEKLLTHLHGISEHRSLIGKLLQAKPVVSLEVIASGSTGLKFIIVLPRAKERIVKGVIRANLPHTEIKKVSDYKNRFSSASVVKTSQFKLKHPFYNGLKVHEDCALTYAASFADMGKNELVAFQLNLSPLPERFNKKAQTKLAKKNDSRPGWLIRLFKFIARLIRLSLAKKLLTNAKELKLDDLLFKVDFRLIAAGDSKQTVSERTKSFYASLAGLAMPGQQTFTPKKRPDKFIWLSFWHRAADAVNRNTILSVKELSSIYHFPGIDDYGSGDVLKNLSRSLPLDLKSRQEKAEVAIGKNLHGEKPSLIGLSRDERLRHLYIIGGTGNGKTTMLEYMAYQDIKSDRGLMVVDPHGDLAESLLTRIPKSRIADVIYLNPADIDHPIGINLLDLPKGLDKTALAVEKDRISESIISVFRKTFDSKDDGNAYRIERLLRNAIHTALSVKGATLFSVSRLLSDKYYRWEIIQGLSDDRLKRFWLEEFNKAGDYQRVKMGLGPLARLERYESNIYTRNIIGQAKSGFDFDKAVQENKIIICNLSKGAISEDASHLIGSLLLSKLQLAMLRRQALKPSDRHPFYLYVDEFQNYANSSFVSMFSEARKYGLSMTMAQQSLSQLSDQKLLNVILDNVGSLLTFRLKSLDSQKLIMSQFAPYITKNEISNLPRYSFYAKLSATEPKEPVSGSTIVLDPVKNDVTNQIIESSRRLYSSSGALKARALIG